MTDATSGSTDEDAASGEQRPGQDKDSASSLSPTEQKPSSDHAVSVARITTVGSVIIAIIGLGGTLVQQRRAEQAEATTQALEMDADRLVLNCPLTVRSNETMVHGRAKKESRISVLVKPLDGSKSSRFRQQGEARVSADGVWSHDIRLGNPYGIDQRKKPPLSFSVYAVALESGQAFDADDLGLDPLQQLRTSYGTDDVGECTIDRQPEASLRCLDEKVKLLNPKPHACQFSALELTSRECNPARVTIVTSPVKLSWEPAKAMFVKLYSKGAPAYGLDGRSKRTPDDPPLELENGTYELKLSAQQDAECSSSAWFEVRTGCRAAIEVAGAAIDSPNLVDSEFEIDVRLEERPEGSDRGAFYVFEVFRGKGTIKHFIKDQLEGEGTRWRGRITKVNGGPGERRELAVMFVKGEAKSQIERVEELGQRTGRWEAITQFAEGQEPCGSLTVVKR